MISHRAEIKIAKKLVRNLCIEYKTMWEVRAPASDHKPESLLPHRYRRTFSHPGVVQKIYNNLLLPDAPRSATEGEHMPKPLLIFRIGWMDTYQGIDEIHGGGSYVAEHGEGGEMWNFREEGGRCYGYVMTKNFAGIDLSRILPDEEWIEGAELPDVDIVFISKSLEPNIGQVVVGWHKNAIVFHKEYRKRRGSKKQGDWDNIDYLCEVSDENATLLQVPDRTFQIPRGKGFPGQSNVWYENKKKFRCYPIQKTTSGIYKQRLQYPRKASK